MGNVIESDKPSIEPTILTDAGSIISESYEDIIINSTNTDIITTDVQKIQIVITGGAQ